MVNVSDVRMPLPVLTCNVSFCRWSGHDVVLSVEMSVVRYTRASSLPVLTRTGPFQVVLVWCCLQCGCVMYNTTEDHPYP